jgi:predicted dehydrogenase
VIESGLEQSSGTFMVAETEPWRVGIVGMSSAGLFHLERLSLRPDVRLAGVFDRAPARIVLANDRSCPVWDELRSGLTSSDIDALFLVDDILAEDVSTALRHGKQVVVHRPWLLSPNELQSLDDQASSSGRVATISCLRRWSTDFVAAVAAKQTGRLGALQTVRLTSCEQSVADDNSFAGILPEFGFHWFDQLLKLIESRPTRIFATRLNDSDSGREQGFLVVVDFENGCHALIDVRTQSRLSLRTGWMLEGSLGSYRGNRLYTRTADGEIVDEPLPLTAFSSDAFMDELVSAWGGGPASLPTLTEAARVVRFIESIEQSAATGQPVLQ